MHWFIGYRLLAIAYADEPKASSSAFGGFGGVFLSMKIIATTTAFFDFVGLFSH
jgi:hypothetical protein